MARKDVSPLGYNSAIAMVVYFKNRAGRRLKTRHKHNLIRAISLLRYWKLMKR